jgi:hypothetical protein
MSSMMKEKEARDLRATLFLTWSSKPENDF